MRLSNYTDPSGFDAATRSISGDQLGTDGFVGIKTGSMDASGGCFVFLTRRHVRGRVVWLYEVVLGQQGADLIAGALGAARSLADQVAAA